jgi:hypothetical protein
VTRLAPTHELRKPTGLDEHARRVIVRALGESKVAPASLVYAFMRQGTFSGIRDYLHAVEEVHGQAAGFQTVEMMRQVANAHENLDAIDWERDQAQAKAIGGPLGLLLGMPAPDFLTAVELGIAAAPSPIARAGTLASEINRICKVRGIPYRVQGIPAAFVWTGDAEIQKNVLAPALSILDDPRLRHGSRVEFDSARRELRTNTRDSRKQAITEACSSVESAMKVVCSEKNVAVTDKATAQPLFDALVTAHLVPRENEAMVLGPARFGNKRGRHGGGPVAHDVTEPEAEQVVAAAAVAIVYLAKLLP